MMLWLLQGTSLMLVEAHKWGVAPSTGGPALISAWAEEFIVRRGLQNWWWPIECEDPSYIHIYCVCLLHYAARNIIMVAFVPSRSVMMRRQQLRSCCVVGILVLLLTLGPIGTQGHIRGAPAVYKQVQRTLSSLIFYFFCFYKSRSCKF